MARRYELITELYHSTIGSLAAPQEWQRFLATACRNFRLPFDEQVLLFAQRPDATAVLTIEGRNGWNERFGRWVNRGVTGIAVFDGEAAGRSRLKYYFDISDTHESRFSRPVPIWTMRPEFAPAIMETLENSFGELEDKTDLAAALLSAAKNAVEDNMPDYLAELKYYRENSFLEELDDLNIGVEYRRALENSIGYMLLVRCGIDPAGYFTDDDFRDVTDFNTPETLNALGTATGDIGQMCLTAISRTALSLQRQAGNRNRTFAPGSEIRYPDAGKANTTPERSDHNERTDIHDEGRLPVAEPPAAPGAGNSPWEIRIASEDLPEAAPQGDVHEPADVGQAEPAPDGDRAGGALPDGTADQPDGGSRGGDGGTESQRPDEVDGADEQPAALGGGDRSERAGLQLTPQEPDADLAAEGVLSEQQNISQEADNSETGLPAFLDEKLIMAVIANKDDGLKYKKQQIELYFSIHPEEAERAEYLKSAYQDRYTEILVDGVRVGYRPQEDGLLMWEGAYPSRTSETVFSWGAIAGWTAQLIDKKEYFIQTDIKPAKSYDSQQLTLFDFADFNAPAQEESGQLSFLPRPQLPQQVIDTALCLGGNEPDSLERIYAFFSKDYPLEQNAEFLKEEYRRDGKGFFLGDKPYSLWFDEAGIRISSGRSASGRNAAILTWEDAAKRVRALLDAGRYVPQTVIGRADEVEKKALAEKILYLVQDFTEEARQAGYLPTVQDIYNTRSGHPDMAKQLSEKLHDRAMVETLIAEAADFLPAYEENRGLLRFRFHRPKEILAKLEGLLRETVDFPVPESAGPEPKQFITDDEIDKLLTGGGGIQNSKFRIYAYYLEGHTPKERAAFLKNEYGIGGSGRMGFDENHDGKGISYAREDRLFQPYDKILLPWNKVESYYSQLPKKFVTLHNIF